jgi:hypothetical protein
MLYRQDIAFSLILPCGVVKLTPQGPSPKTIGTNPLKYHVLPYLSEKNSLRYRKISFFTTSALFGLNAHLYFLYMLNLMSEKPFPNLYEPFRRISYIKFPQGTIFQFPV